MKLKQLSVLFLTAGALIFTGCSDDDKETDNTQAQTDFVAKSKTSSDVDVISDDVLYIIENEYNSQNAGRPMEAMDTQDFLPECATSVTTTVGNIWETTIDFGTTGCAMPNGNILKGIIVINGSTDFSAMSQTINYSFQNFYHNNRLIEGNRYVVRVLQNGNGNPQSTIELDFTVTFPNNIVVTREGNRAWEWVAGVDTPFNPLDNEYLVTGEWTTAFPDNTLTTEVTEALRIRGFCAHVVEGILTFTDNSNTVVLNYGNGECNNEAYISINGGSFSTFYLD